jgi:hypothetical protein
MNKQNTTSVSEFERNKPTKTMKAINKALKEMKTPGFKSYDTCRREWTVTAEWVTETLEEIKKKFMAGE